MKTIVLDECWKRSQGSLEALVGLHLPSLLREVERPLEHPFHPC